jgi:NADH-quinone oxidoreductase subunit H
MVKGWALYMVPVIIGVSFPRFRPEDAIRFFLRIPTATGVLAVVISSQIF